MTKDEYIESKKKAGHILHQHDGVWWENVRPGYCKPAIKYEAIPPLEVRPAFKNSYIGYSHRITNIKYATGFWQPFILNEKGLAEWSIDTLKNGKRRGSIKKGLKVNEVKRLNNVEHYREEFARVLKSTALRNGHGHPPEYYDLDKNEWWDTIMKVDHYSEFWCAFQNDTLAGYISLHVLGDRVIIDGVKSDTNLLPGCPMDAIIFHFLMDLKERGGIKEIWYGGKSNTPTLDKFKMSYGFVITKIPYTIRIAGGLFKYPNFFR